MPSVYVYPLPSSLMGEWLYDNLTAGDHDNHFRTELELLHRFRAMPQAPPARADMLLVPFMLTQAFTRLRKGRSARNHAELLAWNERVVAAMRAIGPYWDTRRRRHAVFAQRCAGNNDLRRRSLAWRTWPPLWDDPEITLLCFEPIGLGRMGRGVLIPYGVGHGAGGLRCPAARRGADRRDPSAHAPREATLVFAGSVETSRWRNRWVAVMRAHGPPRCRLVLFSRANRTQRYSPTGLEEAMRTSSFSVQLQGHVGPRKAIFDSVRCGAVPVIASDVTPLAFSDVIDYSSFALRVPVLANVSAVIAALLAIPTPALAHMRAAMNRAARLLDAGPRGRMAEVVLGQFMRVAGREVESSPRATGTPLPVQRCVGPMIPAAKECSAPPQITMPGHDRTRA